MRVSNYRRYRKSSILFISIFTALTILLLALSPPAASAAVYAGNTYDDIYISKIALMANTETHHTWSNPGNFYSVCRLEDGDKINKVYIELYANYAHFVNYDKLKVSGVYLSIQMTITNGEGYYYQETQYYDSYSYTSKLAGFTFNIDEITISSGDNYKISYLVRLT